MTSSTNPELRNNLRRLFGLHALRPTLPPPPARSLAPGTLGASIGIAKEAQPRFSRQSCRTFSSISLSSVCVELRSNSFLAPRSLMLIASRAWRRRSALPQNALQAKLARACRHLCVRSRRPPKPACLGCARVQEMSREPRALVTVSFVRLEKKKTPAECDHRGRTGRRALSEGTRLRLWRHGYRIAHRWSESYFILRGLWGNWKGSYVVGEAVPWPYQRTSCGRTWRSESSTGPPKVKTDLETPDLWARAST